MRFVDVRINRELLRVSDCGRYVIKLNPDRSGKFDLLKKGQSDPPAAAKVLKSGIRSIPEAIDIAEADSMPVARKAKVSA